MLSSSLDPSDFRERISSKIVDSTILKAEPLEDREILEVLEFEPEVNGICRFKNEPIYRDVFWYDYWNAKSKFEKRMN
jgi:hypothetical protein